MITIYIEFVLERLQSMRTKARCKLLTRLGTTIIGIEWLMLNQRGQAIIHTGYVFTFVNFEMDIFLYIEKSP